MKCIMVLDINNEPMNGGSFARVLPRRWTTSIYSIATLALAPMLRGQELHDHLFNAGGMDQARKSLLGQCAKADIAIGFSAGGTVLWQACLAGFSCPNLVCLSSTRLRYETIRPAARTHVLFDAADPSIPQAPRLRSLADSYSVAGMQGHDAYCDPSSILSANGRKIISEILHGSLPPN